MVFKGVEDHPLVRQMAKDLRVALLGVGLVVVIGKNGLHAQLLRQRRNGLHRIALQHQQAHAVVPVGAAQGAQLLVHIQQCGLNEFHPPVGPGQGIQNRAVEHKHTPHALAVLEGVVQRRVVFCAHVAAQPHQARRVRGGGLHGLMLQPNFGWFATDFR